MARSRLLCAAAIVAACLLGPAALASACAGDRAVPTSANVARVERATACLINAARAQNGLPRLRTAPALGRAAAFHAQEMVANGYFSHDGSDGTTPTQRAKRAGFMPRNGALDVGEIIAWGSGSLGSPAEIVQSWLQSPPHRATLLDRRFRQVGVGIVLGAPGTGESGATVTAELGVRG
jgi:uncharacterized protein YkwD